MSIAKSCEYSCAELAPFLKRGAKRCDDVDILYDKQPYIIPEPASS